MTFINQYLEETVDILRTLDQSAIERCVEILAQTRDRGGRVFVLGVGGSSSSASHLVGDLRKICRLEAYAPTDNTPELTARTNDDGWPATFAEWLDVSHLSPADCLFIFSVGGGSQNVSANLVSAIDLAIEVGTPTLGITGPLGGHLGPLATSCVKVPTKNRTTPHTEGVAMVVAHLLVSHPRLAK